VSVLLYHLLCPAKYRRVVFTEEVDKHLKTVCLEISKRYEVQFVEIGTDRDHAHCLVQSVPMYSASRIAQIVKSVTAREIFKLAPSVKKQLWGREFWSKDCFVKPLTRRAIKKKLPIMLGSRAAKKYINNNSVSS
jgi:REP element-mobilizing transposase RayT